jgi:hypothetical protein
MPRANLWKQSVRRVEPERPSREARHQFELRIPAAAERSAAFPFAASQGATPGASSTLEARGAPATCSHNFR